MMSVTMVMEKQGKVRGALWKYSSQGFLRVWMLGLGKRRG